jgi:hypothetical protein
MAKVKIGKPPAGLSGDALLSWLDDQYEEAYEKQLYDHREARRKAEAKVEELTAQSAEMAKQVPGADSVVLKGKDAEKWAELSKVDLAALQAKAAEGERITRRAFLTEAAVASGFNPKTFAELVELRGLRVEAREADGKKAYVVVTKVGDAAKDVDVATHFKTAEADWLPALAVAGRQQPPGTPPAGRLPTNPPPPNGTDPQRAVLLKAQAEAARHQNVVARVFNPPTTNAGGKD